MIIYPKNPQERYYFTPRVSSVSNSRSGCLQHRKPAITDETHELHTTFTDHKYGSYEQLLEPRQRYKYFMVSEAKHPIRGNQGEGVCFSFVIKFDDVRSPL